MRSGIGAATLSVCFLGSFATPASATPPTLFSNPAYQSPVRADPDDLLMLAGDGFAPTDTVVYEQLTDGTAPLVTPTTVPDTSTALTGVAPIASSADAPNALTIQVPAVIEEGRVYALWVRNQAGEWSNGVRINDARPLWVTPDYGYATRSLASLPRELKVVGRNLLPETGATTQVRLTGPGTYTLIALASGSAVDRYAARVQLPAEMLAGTYAVAVSRDSGMNWVPLTGQAFTVKPDPPPLPDFEVSAQGCAPDDGVDDTPCILAAIAAARAAGGGNVVFAPGMWDMQNSSASGVTSDGVLVPVGVNLIGCGKDATTIVRSTTWLVTRPSFSLQGRNTVRGIHFLDARIYQSSDWAGPILQLGVSFDRAKLYRATDPTFVSDVTITDNLFARPFIGIGDGGLPIDHLFVTYNEFGAFLLGLFPNGNSNNTTYPFHIDDSVVRHNVFKPGSYYAPPSQGAMAAEMGGGRRVDFSDNIADGSSVDYLYDPENEPKGWRAAFFWHMNDNQEMLLVSQNTALCPGDRAGDGEAIAFDNNHNTFGLAAPRTIDAATASSVTVQGPLLTKPANYYVGHWVHVVQGPGLGQARKIVAYTADASGSPVMLSIAPEWDVVPQAASSQIFIARTYWQVVTVDNYVDQRQPLCQKSNVYRPKGGLIALYAQTTDSVAEANRQYDSDGILLAHQFTPTGTGTYGSMLQYFTEIRGNTIDHEYRYSSDCSMSGVTLAYGATPDLPPPVAGFGESISHNVVTQADGLRGGAIAFSRGWYAGPAPYNWKFIDGALVFKNLISDLTVPTPLATSCDGGVTKRSGIHFYDALVWRPTLYGNLCRNVAAKLDDGAIQTQKYCPSGALGTSCECPP